MTLNFTLYILYSVAARCKYLIAAVILPFQIVSALFILEYKLFKTLHLLTRKCNFVQESTLFHAYYPLLPLPRSYIRVTTFCMFLCQWDFDNWCVWSFLRLPAKPHKLQRRKCYHLAIVWWQSQIIHLSFNTIQLQ